MSCIHPLRLKAACTSFKLCECGENQISMQYFDSVVENAAMSTRVGDFFFFFEVNPNSLVVT